MITFAAMNLLSVNNLSKAYGAKVLFKNINFGINYGDKVALVAKNGSGKTSLFKILKGIASLLSINLRKTSDKLAEFMPPLA